MVRCQDKEPEDTSKNCKKKSYAPSLIVAKKNGKRTAENRTKRRRENEEEYKENDQGKILKANLLQEKLSGIACIPRTNRSNCGIDGLIWQGRPKTSVWLPLETSRKREPRRN